MALLICHCLSRLSLFATVSLASPYLPLSLSPLLICHCLSRLSLFATVSLAKSLGCCIAR